MKRKNFKVNASVNDDLNMFIKPFQERPDVIVENGLVDRISAHDLFSYYTADIIKKDTIFAR